jgi:hypothetical protein
MDFPLQDLILLFLNGKKAWHLVPGVDETALRDFRN